jgi:hypothetical protein
VASLPGNSEDACVVAGPRERGVEAKLEVRELEARKLLSVDRQLPRVLAEMLDDRLRDRLGLAVRLREQTGDELAELRAEIVAGQEATASSTCSGMSKFA